MIEKVLNAAFDNGLDVLIFLKGFGEALKGRIQDIDGDYCSLLQTNKMTSILFVFRKEEVLCCSLFLSSPAGFTDSQPMDETESSSSSINSKLSDSDLNPI
jgi:sRNA-binding regulator protein Hfq